MFGWLKQKRSVRAQILADVDKYGACHLSHLWGLQDELDYGRHGPNSPLEDWLGKWGLEIGFFDSGVSGWRIYRKEAKP